MVTTPAATGFSGKERDAETGLDYFGALRVYGSENAQAIRSYSASNGLINVKALSNDPDANFISVQTRGREENYLGVSQAAALFTAASVYGQNHPDDGYLVFTGGSTAKGLSALKPDGKGGMKPIHAGHTGGPRSI